VSVRAAWGPVVAEGRANKRRGDAAGAGGDCGEEVDAGEAALAVARSCRRRRHVDNGEAGRVPARGAVERVRDAARLLRVRHSAAGSLAWWRAREEGSNSKGKASSRKQPSLAWENTPSSFVRVLRQDLPLAVPAAQNGTGSINQQFSSVQCSISTPKSFQTQNWDKLEKSIMLRSVKCKSF